MRLFLLLLLPALAFGQSVSILSGNGQVVRQHYRFDPLRVQVRTASGAPASGVTVTWRVSEGNGQAVFGNLETTASSTTNGDGVAEILFYQNPFPIFGTSFAQSKVTASALGVSTVFVETTTFLDSVSGAEQVNVYPLSPVTSVSGPSGSVNEEPIRISVSGFLGGPVPGVALTVLDGDASNGPALACISQPGQQPGTVLTDETGTATCQLQFSGQPGTGTYQARIGGAWRLFPFSPAGFTVTPAQNNAFNIVSGNSQNGTVGVPLQAPLVAGLKNPAGNPVAGAAVTWELVSGTGVLGSTGTVTDSAGLVSTAFTPQATGVSQVRVQMAANPAVQATFTVTVAPTNPGNGGGNGGGNGSGGCGYAVNPTVVSAPAAGTSATVSVTPNGIFCSWKVSSNAPWITLTSNTDVSGPGVVAFSVAPNTGVPRTGTLTAGGQTITVSQQGTTQAACTAVVDPGSLQAGSSGGAGSLNVTADTACAWTVAANVWWLQATPMAGQGSRAVSYTVYPNFAARSRVGNLLIGGRSVAVTQAAAPGTEAERFVSYINYNGLGRVLSSGEVAAQVNELGSGSGRDQFVANILDGPQFQDAGYFIAALYPALLNRLPDFASWLPARNAFAAGKITTVEAVDLLLKSEEFRQKNGDLSDAAFVTLLYRQALQRTPDASEVEIAVAALRAGVFREQIVINFVQRAEFLQWWRARLKAFALYGTILQRSPSPFELSGMVSQLEAGATTASRAATLLNGQEFQSLLQ